MKRFEFVSIWCDAVRRGRRRTFADMRESEHAVARMGDERRALGLWRKHRAHYSQMTAERFRAELAHMTLDAITKGTE